jgi:phosphomannomutase
MEPAELRKSAERWMGDDPDPETREELRALLRQPDLAATDLADRFAGPLEFGTAGLRGVLAAGPNRMNLAVVVRATWGIAQELLAGVPGAAMRGVVVGGDARRMSRQFSEHAAVILAAAGIKVVLFRTPVPTPLVGFAVKSLGAAAGVVITASHNPPEYNGYKVYWENAAQIVPPIDARIAAAIARAPAASDVVQKALRDMEARGLVTDAPPSLERAYLDAIRALAVHPNAGDRALRIVYTPLHGVGDALVRRALSEGGFTDVTSVPEQQKPDGTFPTVAFPNPEEKGAMDLSFALAKTTGAHLVLANDPDADRLAMAVPEGDGFRQLTGNQVGVLLGHYLLTERPAGPKPRAVLASIVSSPLLGRIAGSLGVRYEETLTGFKWIANRAMELERDPEPCEFVFGYEEALGYEVGDIVSDKDGLSAALVVAELAARAAAEGTSVVGRLDGLAARFGVYANAQWSLRLAGPAAQSEMAEVVDRWRRDPPASLAGLAVVEVVDYAKETGELPATDALLLRLEEGARVVLRPSGTEPKLKAYLEVATRPPPPGRLAEARGRAGRVLQTLREDVAVRCQAS